jgi:predicted nucleic-acid-binding protein
MIALDTNVVIRALTQDDPEQAKKAARVLRGSSLHVSKTVLVEVEWVLRKAYGFSADRINDALGRFVGLRALRVEDRTAVVRALDWHARGMDFADALHLASSATASAFATFDASFARRASQAQAEPPVRLL